MNEQQQHDPYGDHFGPGEEIQAPAPSWGVASGRGSDGAAPVVDAVSGDDRRPPGERTYPVPLDADE